MYDQIREDTLFIIFYSIDAALASIPYTDITAALDYYFENYNQGRPFVIAGHSQGSAILRLVLKRYSATSMVTRRCA